MFSTFIKDELRFTKLITDYISAYLFTSIGDYRVFPHEVNPTYYQ